jgi:RNA polymerase sigma-70 factor (family 1)
MLNEKSHIDEVTLLERLRQGDEQAFIVIYDIYKRKLARALQRLLKSDDLVEEVLQDAFLKLWKQRAQILPNQSIGAFLYKISENLVYDVFRRAARDRKLRAMLYETSHEAYSHVEEIVIENERSLQLNKAISLLPPQRQRVFRMCRLEGHSYEEVSKELNISKSTVNDHLLKANRFLRSYLSIRYLIVSSWLLEKWA